jgi:hypothetical protein
MNNTITPTKAQRYQITLPKTPQINSRIQSLMTRYDGMTLTEITKLAFIELDNQNSVMDETDYIKSDPVIYDYLLKAKKEFDSGNFKPAMVIDTNDLVD